jgi:hypothetical protein
MLLKSRDLLQEELTEKCKQIYKQRLKEFIDQSGTILTVAARHIAQLDALMSLVHIAKMPSWVLPQLVDVPQISIVGGRHPVLDSRTTYIPNTVDLKVVDPFRIFIPILLRLIYFYMFFTFGVCIGIGISLLVVEWAEYGGEEFFDSNDRIDCRIIGMS